MFGVPHHHPHNASGLIEKLLPALHHKFGRRITTSSGEDICHDTTHRCCQYIVSWFAIAMIVDLDARSHSMGCSWQATGSLEVKERYRQDPEKLLAALAVLGAAWQSWIHFIPKFTLFWEQQSCSRSQKYALGFSF